mgnify:CR=1 FL=1
MANRIKDDPKTSIIGTILIITGMVGYYFEIDTTVCSMVILGGLGLLGAKDSIFGGKENPKP